MTAKRTYPTVTIIIPTFNAGRMLSMCLASIRTQEYPRSNIEIIVVDGGSKDDTIEIAKNYGVDKIIHNPYVRQEMGKAIGVSKASGDIIAFIDADNVLPDKLWLKKLVKPFLEDETVTGSEPIMFHYRPTDPYMVRYIALLGCDDPLCHILGNRDKWSWVKKNWTDLPIKIVMTRQDYILVEFDKNIRPPTLGANGFLVRSKHLRSVDYRPFLDVDVIYKMIKHGYTKYAKVMESIIHLHAFSPTEYIKKKIKRFYIRNMISRQDDRYPWRLMKDDIYKILLHALIVPLFRDVIRGYRTIPDKAWLIHPLMSIAVLASYGLLFILTRIKKSDKSKLPIECRRNSRL